MKAASLLRCKSIPFPIPYLGFQLGINPRRVVAWKAVVDRIKSRLASWKAGILSMVGRLSLIKSVLNHLPIYYTSLFKIHVGVAKL